MRQLSPGEYVTHLDGVNRLVTLLAEASSRWHQEAHEVERLEGLGLPSREAEPEQLMAIIRVELRGFRQGPSRDRR